MKQVATVSAVEPGARPRALAQLARGTMRGRIRRLEEALECSFFTDQHAAVLAIMLITIDYCTTQIGQLTKIEALTEPYLHQVGQLDQFDGIGVICAQDIIAEIGTDMTVFPTAAQRRLHPVVPRRQIPAADPPHAQEESPGRDGQLDAHHHARPDRRP